MRRIALSVLLLAACGGDAPRDDAALSVDSPAATPSAASADSAAIADGDSARDANAAADVIRRYYAAIDGRSYRDAWLLWSDSGASSRQTLAEFELGFAGTAGVSVEIGSPGRIDAAAGSRYVEVPVVVRAITTDGGDQRFEGSYTLRRAVVDGATAEQRAWRIYSATLRAVE
jgi:hypothetical protein